MRNNFYMSPLGNLNLQVRWMLNWLVAVSLLSLICGQSYGQLPPTPPGFPTSILSTTNKVLLSPKSAELRVSLGPVMIAVAPIISLPSTNHLPPTVSIRWAFSPPESTEIDTSLTNQVPILLRQGVEFGQQMLGIQWIGLTGKTYEIQFMFDGFAWLTYMRLSGSDGEMVGWCGINLNESSRLFRVMSN